MSEQNSSAVLECRQLQKTYEDTGVPLTILSGINFSIKKGEQVAIIGASGTGKSTLLHLLGGLDKPTEGNVLVSGKDINKLTATDAGRLRNKTLGFVYQFHHLLPEFTALENVAMPLLIRGQSVAQAEETATEILCKTGLKDRMKHKPAQLSGGERQRAAIARALVTKPDCVLADEPTGNLDIRNAAQVFDLFVELNESMGLALIVVTHDHAIAEKTGRVMELYDGGIRAA